MTSKGLWHIILQHVLKEGTRWSGQPLPSEKTTCEAFGTWVIVLKERSVNVLLALGRSRRLLFRTDLRDRTVATRVKAKVNYPRVGDTSGLLPSQGREHVSIVTILDTLDEIVLGGKDLRNVGHHSPNHQWDMLKSSFFHLTPTWAKGTGVSPRVLH